MNKESSRGTLLLLSVSVGVAMIGLGVIWPLIPVYAVELGASGFLLGLIIASFNISRVIFGAFVGRISDRLGRKKFILAGLFAYAVVALFYVTPERPETLIIIRFIHGIASIMVVPIAMALAADIAPEEELGLYVGSLNMAIMIGIGIGPALGGVIRDHFGMDAAFYSMSILAILTCALVKIIIPSDSQRTKSGDEKESYPVRKMLSNRILLGIVLMRFMAASGQGAVYTFLPILALQLNIISSQVGIILTSNIFLIAVMQRSCGKLADRMNPKYLVLSGTFAAGLTVLGMPFVQGFFMILALNILMGAANGLALPGGLVITGRLGRTMGMASLMSITEAAWSLGLIVSPILSGIILDVYGLTYVFVAGSALIMAGWATVTILLRDYDPALKY